MTQEHRPRPSISLPGILALSAMIGFSRVAAAGSNTWTGGHPSLAAPATTMIATDPSNPSVVYAAFDSISIAAPTAGGPGRGSVP